MLERENRIKSSKKHVEQELMWLTFKHVYLTPFVYLIYIKIRIEEIKYEHNKNNKNDDY